VGDALASLTYWICLAEPFPGRRRVDVVQYVSRACAETVAHIAFDRWRSISLRRCRGGSGDGGARPLARFAAENRVRHALPAPPPVVSLGVRELNPCRRRAAPFWELAVRRLALPRARVGPFFGAAVLASSLCPLALCRSFGRTRVEPADFADCALFVVFEDAAVDADAARERFAALLPRFALDRFGVAMSSSQLVQTNGRRPLVAALLP
jgi:hypothetical protein